MHEDGSDVVGAGGKVPEDESDVIGAGGKVPEDGSDVVGAGGKVHDAGTVVRLVRYDCRSSQACVVALGFRCRGAWQLTESKGSVDAL